MARSSVRDSRSTSEKQTQRASTRSRAVFFEKVSVYGPKMMCETSESGTAGTRTSELFAGSGAAGPGAARGGGCAGPTACGLVWGRWCLARTGREARERCALHQAASAAATAKAAPGRRAPPRGRGAAIAGLHDLCVADCAPLQRETVVRQHQPFSPALGATIVVLVKVGAGLHDLNEVDVNMLRAIRGCLSGGRYRAGGRGWAEAGPPLPSQWPNSNLGHPREQLPLARGLTAAEFPLPLPVSFQLVLVWFRLLHSTHSRHSPVLVYGQA